MKRFIGTIVLVLLGTALVFSQSIMAAETALKNGELEKAKTAIDGVVSSEIKKIATKNAKMKARGKTDKIVPEEPSAKVLYTKATVYQAIALSEKPEERSLAENAPEEAAKAFKKVIEKEKENSILRLQSEAKFNALYVGLLNMGNNHYNAGDMKKTVNYFYRAGMLQDTDTIGLNNAFIVAAQNDMPEEADKAGKIIIERETGNKEFYLMYANEFRKKEDYEGLLKIAKMGAKKFPEEPNMGRLMVEAYSKLDRVDEAIEVLEKEAKTTKDPLIFGNLAVLYENKGNQEKVVENYKKALELNPENYAINFNMGAMYYNRAVEVAKKRNNLPANNRGEFDDQEKAKELLEKIKTHYKESVPYFEQAYAKKPENEDGLNILSMLSQMYKTLEMTDKQKEAEAKIKAAEDK